MLLEVEQVEVAFYVHDPELILLHTVRIIGLVVVVVGQQVKVEMEESVVVVVVVQVMVQHQAQEVAVH